MPSNENLSSSYGIGFKLLKQMGFTQGEGIGRKQQGITIPISHTDLRPKQAGLGYIQEEKMGAKEERPLKKAADKHVKSSQERRISQDLSPPLEGRLPEPLQEKLGNARDIFSSLHAQKKPERVPPSPKQLLELEEKKLALLRIEKKRNEVQIPVYEALLRFSISIKEGVNSLKESLKLKDQLGLHLSQFIKNTIIPPINCFYSQLNVDYKTFSAFDDRVAGELRRTIEDTMKKATMLLLSLNNILIALLVPIHRKGSLLDMDAYFPTTFTKQVLPVYYQLELLLREIITEPTLFQCLIYGLLLPAIKNHLRAMRVPEYGQIFYWLEALGPEYSSLLFESVIVPHLQEVVFDISIDSLQSFLDPWLPFSKPDSLLDLLFQRILASPFSDIREVETILEILRSLDDKKLPTHFEKKLVAKLTNFLRLTFKINPADQSLDPLELVIEASDLLDLSQLATIISSGAIPLLSSFATLWMKSATHSELKATLADDMLEWYWRIVFFRYTGWKLLFPQELHAIPSIVCGFRSIVDAFNREFDAKAPGKESV